MHHEIQTGAIGVFLGMIAYRVANLCVAAIAHAFVLLLAERWPHRWAGFAASFKRSGV
ncbi:hypothetical protein [Xanthomonas arboricola]|uniref:hypothetical protein n=1 Tax=Xanthomonas arboricola TaxID=56448 RepID=UPI0012D340C9|nr:hypothetical protein [Xanthomonas arboricola]